MATANVVARSEGMRIGWNQHDQIKQNKHTKRTNNINNPNNQITTTCSCAPWSTSALSNYVRCCSVIPVMLLILNKRRPPVPLRILKQWGWLEIKTNSRKS